MNFRVIHALSVTALSMAMLTLTGCAQSSDTVTMKGQDGATVTVNTNGGGKVPADFPISVYPGSSTTSVAQTGGGAGTPTAMVFLESSDSPDKIFSYYKNELQGKNWKIDQEVNTEGVSSLTASNGGQTVTMGITNASGKSTVTISVIKNGQ